MNLTAPVEFNAVLKAFAPLFSRPVWGRVQALVSGMLLTSKSTITAALRMLGWGGDGHFENSHRVFNRACWSALDAARTLLNLLVEAFVPAHTPLVFGLDETIERRRGRCISARAIYRDPVRSSKECPQKTSGLRWMSVHLLVPIRWARRVWALPVLTALGPSERYAPYVKKGRQHKPLPRRARGLIGRVWRWLANHQRPIIFVGDNAYSALELLGWCSRLAARSSSRGLAFITRLRLDAALYEPAPPSQPGQRGRPRRKGARLPTLHQVLEDKATRWSRLKVPWYGSPGVAERTVEIASGRCVWFHGGMPAVPIRWVLIRDPAGQFDPQALLSTDQTLAAHQIVEFFVRRWPMEVTFEEVNAHLGLPGQRQWNDLAIERSTPVRLGLFSLVALLAQQQQDEGHPIPVRRAAWYAKEVPTFSDALAAVRRLIWAQVDLSMSDSDPDITKPSEKLFTHMAEMLSYAA